MTAVAMSDAERRSWLSRHALRQGCTEPAARAYVNLASIVAERVHRDEATGLHEASVSEIADVVRELVEHGLVRRVDIRGRIHLIPVLPASRAPQRAGGIVDRWMRGDAPQ